MLKRLVPHFYPKMHLDDFWRPLFRNPSSLMDVLSPFIPVICHSDWLFHGESCPRLDVVHPGRAWPSSPSWRYTNLFIKQTLLWDCVRAILSGVLSRTFVYDLSPNCHQRSKTCRGEARSFQCLTKFVILLILHFKRFWSTGLVR